MNLGRAALAEFVGTALLLAAVVGSGTMGERLSGGNDALALLANSAATGCALFVLVLMFARISGAHLNPLVTAVARFERAIGDREAVIFIGAQVIGAFAGVALAHGMFDVAFAPSLKPRAGFGQWLAEGVAAFGLVLVVLGVRIHGTAILAAAIGAYVAGAYWFTASTSFANPAVTLARAFTPTFAGIAPSDVFGFVVSQCVGTIAAVVVARLLGFGTGAAGADVAGSG